MTAGKFITLEGGEGAGKSTQAHLLAEALEQGGHQVVITREPGGTPGAETIRQLLLDTEGPGWTLEAEALLFAAARADHVAGLIRPALVAGKWVICDRYVDSTRAYQGNRGSLSDADILELNRIGSAGLMPDLTLLLEVSDQERDKRLALRDAGNADRIGGRDAEFHASVARRFAEIAAAEGERIVVINGNGSASAVYKLISDAVTEHLGAFL